MKDYFCIMPFRHQMIEPSGSVKVCCMAEGYVEIDGRPASVYEFALDQIWRSEFMRKIRADMLSGTAPAICNRCYEYESAGGTSYRAMSNSQYIRRDDPPPTAEGYALLPLDDDLVSGRPDFYQLVLGNFCNLKCRMCSPTFSSSIENDPVQSAWIPHADARLPTWRRDVTSIGPQPTLMVKQSGLGELQWRDGRPLLWTMGDTAFHLPWRESTPAERLEIEIWDDSNRDREVTLVVNGIEREYSLPRSGTACLEFPLVNAKIGLELSIGIRSRSPLAVHCSTYNSVEFQLSTSNASSLEVKVYEPDVMRTYETRGVPLKDVRLHRTPMRARSARTAFANRFSGDRTWQEQNSLLFAEILSEPTRLRKLQLTGGEPFFLPQMEEMLEYLIDTGAAGNVILNISTNCTTLTDAHLDKLSRFNRVELCLSIEGVKVDQEYIRYPSRWSEVSANAERFKSLENAHLQINPTLQVYNFMRMDLLIRWCESIGVSFYPQRLAFPPQLSIEVAPAATRIVAAERIRNLLPDIVDPTTLNSANALVQMLEEKLDEPADSSMIADFMRFTNDLDHSRNQDFAQTHPELLEAFRAAGFPWLNESRHLDKAKAVHRTPAVSGPSD